MTKFEKFKQHVKDHPAPYMAASFAGGCVATYFIGQRIDISNVVAPVFNNAPTFINENAVNMAGPAVKITQRLSDGHIFGSAKEAAMEIAANHNVAFETARTLLSKNTNGFISDVYGEAYKTIALGTIA